MFILCQLRTVSVRLSINVQQCRQLPTTANHHPTKQLTATIQSMNEQDSYKTNIQNQNENIK